MKPRMTRINTDWVTMLLRIQLLALAAALAGVALGQARNFTLVEGANLKASTEIVRNNEESSDVRNNAMSALAMSLSKEWRSSNEQLC